MRIVLVEYVAMMTFRSKTDMLEFSRQYIPLELSATYSKVMLKMTRATKRRVSELLCYIIAV